MAITHEAKCDQCGSTAPARELDFGYKSYAYPKHWVSVSRDDRITTVCSPKCAARWLGY